MSRKSKRESEAVRPVIENLQPRVLLSGTDPNPDPMPAGRAPEFNAFPGRPGVYLALYGTDQDDVIGIEPGALPGQVIVTGVAGVADGTQFDNIASVSVSAGAGDDTVTVNMTSVDAENALWPTIYGEEGDYLLTAQAGAELVDGAGNDTLIDSEGDDKFWPDRGNDVIRGGAGMDMLYIHNTCYVAAAAVGEGNALATSRAMM